MPKLYFAFIFFLPFTAAAQSYELKPFYETITSKTAVKHAGDFGLKGNVHTVKETLYKKQVADPKDEDTIRLTRYHFTVGGLLDTLSKGDSLSSLWNSGAYQEVYTYDEKSRRLKEFTVYDGSYYAHILTKTFGPEGFLMQERFDARFNENSGQFNYTAYYTYNKSFSELSIRYKYDESETHYDRKDDGTWKFTFNNAGLLTNEVHKEQDFGSSTTISYHPKWNLPAGITLMESCATQNSCLFLSKSISYDDKGRKSGESLSDHTIRNSMWSYDYCFQYAYNERGELLKKATCALDKLKFYRTPNLQTRSAKPSLKLAAMGSGYEYVYDAAGNWIEQKEYFTVGEKKTKLIAVTKREIGYY